MINFIDSIFYKISGAGNCFAFSGENLVIDKNPLEKKNLIRRICDPIYGLSCDGVVFIKRIEEASLKEPVDFIWDFYNSDGSSAEMCGNAARCAALFCREVLGFEGEYISFQTLAGIIRTRVTDRNGQLQIEVVMPKAIIEKFPHTILYNDTEHSFFNINTGVPHLVLKIDNLSDYQKFRDLALFSRSHQSLGDKGSNITFYEVTGDSIVRAVTFERGVEDFTLACGTGAVAAALAYCCSGKSSLKKEDRFIEVQMPGGPLCVEINGETVKLIGSACLVAEFKIVLEVKYDNI